MDANFKGKRALVTGAGKGIGRSIAKTLAQCGAEVIALSRTQADLDTLVKEVPSIKPLCVDLDNIEEAVKAIEHQDDIHLLVNNAAVWWRNAFLDDNLERFNKMMNVILKGTIFVTQAVARKMVAGNYGGSIVNISSAVSVKPVSGMAVYGCLKAAQDMLTKSMALELGPHKIRVNTVSPGLVTDTSEGEEFQAVEDLKAATPLRKLAAKQDVVDSVLYLLSDKAAMANGALLVIDGGLHLL